MTDTTTNALAGLDSLVLLINEVDGRLTTLEGATPNMRELAWDVANSMDLCDLASRVRDELDMVRIAESVVGQVDMDEVLERMDLNSAVKAILDTMDSSRLTAAVQQEVLAETKDRINEAYEWTRADLAPVLARMEALEAELAQVRVCVMDPEVEAAKLREAVADVLTTSVLSVTLRRVEFYPC